MTACGDGAGVVAAAAAGGGCGIAANSATNRLRWRSAGPLAVASDRRCAGRTAWWLGAERRMDPLFGCQMNEKVSNINLRTSLHIWFRSTG